VLGDEITPTVEALEQSREKMDKDRFRETWQSGGLQEPER
jgi:hypothetical protein